MFICVPMGVHMCEMVYVCAHDCGVPRTNEHHPQEHYPPPLETPVLHGLEVSNKVSGQGDPGFHLSWLELQVHSTVSGFFWGGALRTEFRSSWFLPTESSPQPYIYMNFKVSGSYILSILTDTPPRNFPCPSQNPLLLSNQPIPDPVSSEPGWFHLF